MKKLLFIAAWAAISISSFAQKSEVRSAKNALADKDFSKAQKAVDAAVANPETQNDPAAWHVRSMVYLAMQQQPGNEGKRYYEEAGKSLMKVVELKPTFEKQDVTNKLSVVALYNFNEGLAAYDKQDYTGAFNRFGEVGNIHNIEGGKRFEGNKRFDTIARQASTYQGYSAYYGDKYDEALPLLLKAKNDPIVKDVRNYLMIADIYEAKNDETNLLATINEAKTAYPKEQSVTNRELNYYVKSGKSDVLVGKLEDAIKADPANSELLFNLAIAYDNMANPKDKNNKELPKPANYNELFSKAETAYDNTVKAAPQKADAYYNYGALYFNRAVSINDQMNKLTTSAADTKKYDALKIERDEWFNKAVPHFEKVVSIWEPSAKTLKGDDYNNYQAAIIAAKEIYAKQNNIEKSNEMKKKLETVQQR